MFAYETLTDPKRILLLFQSLDDHYLNISWILLLSDIINILLIFYWYDWLKVLSREIFNDKERQGWRLCSK